MKNAIIFDIDGTLWDSTKQVAESWNIVASKFHNPFIIKEKEIVPLMGKPMTEFAHVLFPDEMSHEEKLKMLEDCLLFENEYLKTHPGTLYKDVKETLEILKNDYDLLLLSNCQKNYIEVFLEGTGLGYLFKDHVCWGDNLKKKHENIKVLLERGGYENCVYVGDTEMDENETHLAGFSFVFASFGFGKAKNPEYTLKEFKDLLEIAPKAFR